MPTRQRRVKACQPDSNACHPEPAREESVASPGRPHSPHPGPSPGGRGRPASAVFPSCGRRGGRGLRALIRQAAKDFQSQQQIEVEGYELRELLGQGSMGVVYKAIRKLDQFPVAVKVMLAKVAVHETARQRFLREIEIIRRVEPRQHRGLDRQRLGAQRLLFHQRVLQRRQPGGVGLPARGAGSLAVLAPIILQSLKGLAHAHQHGFVHRDIKPANILLHQQQRGWAAKMGDFGLAKQFEQAGFSGMTLTGAIGGTYDYMPREQLTNFKNTLPVSDVWSLGATFYRVLTGCPRPCPEGRDPMEVVLRDEHSRSPTRSGPAAGARPRYRQVAGHRCRRSVSRCGRDAPRAERSLSKSSC